MNTIISKRPTAFIYQKWEYRNGSMVRVGPGIIINGGAGLVGGTDLLSGRPMDKRSLTIPVGVHTYVDDKVLGELMNIPKFKSDISRGLITVIKGEKLDQDETDNIAEKDMVEDYKIHGRPITEEEMAQTNAVETEDGSYDISNVREGVSPMKVRIENGGQPDYVIKRMEEEREQEQQHRRRGRKRKERKES